MFGSCRQYLPRSIKWRNYAKRARFGDSPELPWKKLDETRNLASDLVKELKNRPFKQSIAKNRSAAKKKSNQTGIDLSFKPVNMPLATRTSEHEAKEIDIDYKGFMPEVTASEAASTEGSDQLELNPIPKLSVGDFVDIKRPKKARISGIITAIADSFHHYEVTTNYGNTIGIRNTDIQFFVRSLMDSEFAKQRLSSLFDFSNLDEDEAYRHKASVITGLFLGAANEKKWSALFDLQAVYNELHIKQKKCETTINEVVRAVYSGDTGPLERYAVFQFMIAEQMKYIPDQFVCARETFIFRPFDDYVIFESLTKKVRLRDPDFNSFISSARKIIEARKNAQPIPNYKFTKVDQDFIYMIKSFALNYDNYRENPFVVGVSGILKMFKLYGDVTKQAASDFLADIGVWPRWEDLNMHHPELRILDSSGANLYDIQYGEVRYLSEHLVRRDPYQYNANKSKATRKDIEYDAHGFYAYDLCENIRRDFGDMPVYTIDDVGVSEVDDGVSLEKNSDGTSWIHIHIADPTAYLPPTHTLAKIASSRMMTNYFPQRVYPMLPNLISKELFSLENVDPAKGINTLTFSAKLGSFGNILDICVSPSIIRNVQSILYDDLDEYLSWGRIPNAQSTREKFNKIHMHPGSYPDFKLVAEKRRKIAPEIMQTIKDMQQLSLQLMDKRIRDGLIVFELAQPSVALHPLPLPITPYQPKVPLGSDRKDPSIVLQLDKGNYSPSRLLVSELMVLGGRVAALWCKERNIPVLFRTQDDSKIPSQVFEDSMALRYPNSGLLNLTHVQNLRQYLSPVQLSLKPGKHATMGISDGYAKCTSPIRRYSDLIVHWQIKANLHGVKSEALSYENLESNMERYLYQERKILRIQSASMNFWTMELLRRIFEESQQGKHSISEWQGRIFYRNPETLAASVLIEELGLIGYLVHREQRKYLGMEIGQKCKVRVAECKPHMGELLLTLV